MKSIPSIPDRCQLLLTQWRKALIISNLERTQLAGEIKSLDRQLDRLKKKELRIAVFGKVGVGKSSLLNGLLGQQLFPTDIAHGSTRNSKAIAWNQSVQNIKSIVLVDTPGIDEIGEKGRARLAARVALHSDVVLLVLDSDLTIIELEALKTLLISGKPVLLVLNRCDQWSKDEQAELIRSIRSRLPQEALKLELQLVAASPRQAEIQNDGRVRSKPCAPMVEPLRQSLITLLSTQGELVLSLNALRRADHFSQSLKRGRLKRSKSAAQSLIGRFAALKASGVAANPLVMLDLAGGLACDTALVIQLSKLYDLQIGGHAARKLLQRLSLYNCFIGGAQVGIQLTLGLLRQLLLLATPITSGLSLAPAAPVALIQAALAVHTTKITGRLAAKELLQGSQRKGAQPRAMLRRLAANEPEVKHLLGEWPEMTSKEQSQLQTLLP